MNTPASPLAPPQSSLDNPGRFRARTNQPDGLKVLQVESKHLSPNWVGPTKNIESAKGFIPSSCWSTLSASHVSCTRRLISLDRPSFLPILG